MCILGGSIYPAVQNVLLACRALGLGASLTTITSLFETEMHDILGWPNFISTHALIPIVYPYGRFRLVSRRPVEEVTWLIGTGRHSRSRSLGTTHKTPHPFLRTRRNMRGRLRFVDFSTLTRPARGLLLAIVAAAGTLALPVLAQSGAAALGSAVETVSP